MVFHFYKKLQHKYKYKTDLIGKQYLIGKMTLSCYQVLCFELASLFSGSE